MGSDKYPKRIDACVSIDGRDLGDSLIAAGLVRPYSGVVLPPATRSSSAWTKRARLQPRYACCDLISRLQTFGCPTGIHSIPNTS